MRNKPNMAERTLLSVSRERDKYREALEKIANITYVDPNKYGKDIIRDIKEIAKDALKG